MARHLPMGHVLARTVRHDGAGEAGDHRLLAPNEARSTGLNPEVYSAMRVERKINPGTDASASSQRQDVGSVVHTRTSRRSTP
jgi:hypothetical protein